MEPLRLAAPPEVAYATRPSVFEATDWRQLDLLPVENEGAGLHSEPWLFLPQYQVEGPDIP